MFVLLAQNIPGYITDVEDLTQGGGVSNMFVNFVSFFFPALPNNSLGYLISRLVLFAIVASGFVFFIKLIAAGYSYLTSIGDPAKIQSATKNLTNAAIGLFVVISSFFIVQIIQVVLGTTPIL